MSAQEKMANLFRELWRDSENEGRELRELLRSAQEDVCSLTCRSHFPAGHVKSEADHSAKCRAITAALAEHEIDDAIERETGTSTDVSAPSELQATKRPPVA